MQIIECPFCAAEIPAHVKKCKHCGEWINKSDSFQSSLDERETCASCGKKMTPRIITGLPLDHGLGNLTPVPKNSMCPFCGVTHRKFPPSEEEQIGLAISRVIFVVIAALFVVLFIFFLAFSGR